MFFVVILLLNSVNDNHRSSIVTVYDLKMQNSKMHGLKQMKRRNYMHSVNEIFLYLNVVQKRFIVSQMSFWPEHYFHL